MSELLTDVVIPDRPTFKASEVCDLLKVQPYVLRSWENEFKDLGAAKTPGAPRTYRRSDVEMALRIRQLVFAEGLTLAGVRRRFEQERPAVVEDDDLAVSEPQVAPETRVRIERAKQALRGVLDLLGAPQRAAQGRGGHAEGAASGRADHEHVPFVLAPPSPSDATVETVSAAPSPRRPLARPRKGGR